MQKVKKSKSKKKGPKRIQVMGPGTGVAELEHCPTVFHVDLDQKQFEAFLSNPIVSSKGFGFKGDEVPFILIQGFKKSPQLRPRWCGHRSDDGGWIFYIH